MSMFTSHKNPTLDWAHGTTVLYATLVSSSGYVAPSDGIILSRIYMTSAAAVNRTVNITVNGVPMHTVWNNSIMFTSSCPVNAGNTIRLSLTSGAAVNADVTNVVFVPYLR